MKNFTITVAFLFLSFSAISQAYHPVIEMNKYWDQSDEDGYTPCSFHPRRYLFIQKDSIINGHNYQLCKSFHLHGIPGPGTMTCPPFVVDTNFATEYWLREDTIAKKVFIYDPYGLDGTDQLLYDFTLDIGDTLRSYYNTQNDTWIVLDAIETVTLHNGETRKKYIFYLPDASYIEGIGGELGIVKPLLMFEHQNRTLYCVKEGSEDIWGEECSTVFAGIENETETAILIFPNPVEDILNVNLSDFPESALYSFEVFDLNSNLILIAKLRASKNVISLTTLPPGFYFYKIKGKSCLRNGKLLKM